MPGEVIREAAAEHRTPFEKKQGPMRCPFCKEDDDKVIDSRSTEGGRCIRRRRRCLRCGRRFTTYEAIESAIKALEEAMNGDQRALIENKASALSSAANQMAAHLYGNQTAQQAAGGAGTSGSDHTSNVVDAEFEDVSKKGS